MPLGERRDGERPVEGDSPPPEGRDQPPHQDGEQEAADAHTQPIEQDPDIDETPKPERRDFIIEAEEEMQSKGPSPWHGLDLDDYDDWA